MNINIFIQSEIDLESHLHMPEMIRLVSCIKKDNILGGWRIKGKNLFKPCFWILAKEIGAGGRNRTDTGFEPRGILRAGLTLYGNQLKLHIYLILFIVCLYKQNNQNKGKSQK
jgi:hypothetical protein